MAAKTAVRFGAKDLQSFAIPSDKPGVPELLERILSATVTPGGMVLVADEKRNKVYRFDAAYEWKGLFPDKDAKERQVTRMLVDGEGGIVCLDRAEKTVRVFDETGKVLRTLGPAGFKQAGGRGGGPVPQRLRGRRGGGSARLQPGGPAPHDPRGPRAEAAEGPHPRRRGALLVYDERAEKVLRYK